MKKLLLASTSPTRKKILYNSNVQFIFKKPLINEEKEKKYLRNKIKPEMICRQLAKKKSIATSTKYRSIYVLGADTCLIFNNKLISKPKTKKKASALLKSLNGKTHKIYTSLFISKNGKRIWSYNDEAKLKIRKLSNKEIKAYIKKIELEKIITSGLYQIEDKGITLFEKIEGSYFTILGLPLAPLLKFLKKTP